MIQEDEFFQKVVAFAAQPPETRFRAYADLHASLLPGYLDAVRAINARGADYVLPEGRSVKQVVGHIVAWDRNSVVAFGEVLAGVRWPRLMSHSAYVDAEGRSWDFPSDDAFNAHFANADQNRPWEEIQAEALDLAETLYHLLTQSGLITPARLENTRVYQFHRQPMPAGWFLWVMHLSHIALEHTDDLAQGRRCSTA